MYEDTKKDSDVFVSDKGRAGNVSSLYSKNNKYKMIAIILIPIDPVGPHCYRDGTKVC
jgi:hypothetical protein